ncbi:hypothetical protein RIF29_30072 [Crotalaria pallida]|uniref:Piwi domain-containing protein n=1 Tax=Crotalaria pallida TaxID=3830 RepID=A0AAN9EG62_CROPI
MISCHYYVYQMVPLGTRPTHNHVLLDEIGFSTDDLQELVHSLSYVYQRSTTAISVVAPICYAHLAATQMGQFMKFEDKSETSSSHGGLTAAGAVPVPQLPKLEEKMRKPCKFSSISCCACTYQFDNLSNSRCYIGNLTNLQIVLLQNNNITGPIPSDLGKLSKLQTLDLSNNFFSGEIPSSWVTSKAPIPEAR